MSVSSASISDSNSTSNITSTQHRKQHTMTIYTPRTLNEAKEIATLISAKPQDCLKLHAAFGSHFGGDMAVTQANSYMLSGKPSLNADAMAGVVRRSGLCRYMLISSWDNDHCTYQCARHDEPESIIHTFTYTIQMAKAQGLTRNRNWQQMPMQMLRARALTMALRAVYPDAVSGMYSPDELADHMDISDKERAKISAESLGEELREPTEQPRPMSAPPQPPSQHQAIPSAPPEDADLPPALKELSPGQRPSPQHVVTRLLDVATMGQLDEEDGSVTPSEWDKADLELVTSRAAEVKTWKQVETYASALWAVAVKPNNASPDELDELLNTIHSLGYTSARLGLV